MTQLYRSRQNRMISGVCGGLGEIYHVDPTLLRLAFAAAAIFSGVVPMVILYLIAAAIIPEGPVTHPLDGPPSEAS